MYEEIVDFIARGVTPDDVAAWVPSQAARDRIAELLTAEKADTISSEGRSELHRYLELEHLMRLAKARAHRIIDHE